MKKNLSETQQLQSLDSRQYLIKSFEQSLQSMDVKSLDMVIKKLNFLCLNFDPYSDFKSTEVENIITEYNLEPYCSNPFEFTNIVLQILDKTENFIKSRVH